MKLLMPIIAVFAFVQLVYANPSSLNVLEESYYQQFKQNLLSGSRLKLNTGFSSFEQKLFVDAAWDLAEDGATAPLDALSKMNTFHYDLSERLRLGILRLKYKKISSLSEDVVNDLLMALRSPYVETKIVYIIAAYHEEILNAGHFDIIDLAKTHNEYFDIIEDQERKKTITSDALSDLFNNTPVSTTYMNGEYVKSVKVFMFCRENRLYPCLMVMRNVHGEVVRNQDGSIWTQQSLASSSRGLPSYTRNGNTPTGILTIDSVMPTADQQISFGQYRRMILNFIPQSEDETLLKSLLPTSSHNEEWWKSSVTARDIGRNLFRIHGTGKINTDPTVPYYPFMRTSGCIAQKENSYDGHTFKDQRELLDAVMVAMDMEPSFDNEIRVKGILYFAEIDDKNSPVAPEDLALIGIE